MPKLHELGGGVWRWTLPHPEWRRTQVVVGSYAVRDGEDTVLIDPLLDDEVMTELDAVLTGAVKVAVTIPYHVRSAAEASARWHAPIIGHPDLAKRLPDGSTVHDTGVTLHTIPQHKELIVQVADTLTFGDRIVGLDGGLRIWAQRPLTQAYRDKLRGWLDPLTRLDGIERILTTHGDPVLEDGRAALADALTAEPVDY